MIPLQEKKHELYRNRGTDGERRYILLTKYGMWRISTSNVNTEER